MDLPIYGGLCVSLTLRAVLNPACTGTTLLSVLKSKRLASGRRELEKEGKSKTEQTCATCRIRLATKAQGRIGQLSQFNPVLRERNGQNGGKKGKTFDRVLCVGTACPA